MSYPAGVKAAIAKGDAELRTLPSGEEVVLFRPRADLRTLKGCRAELQRVNALSAQRLRELLVLARIIHDGDDASSHAESALASHARGEL